LKLCVSLVFSLLAGAACGLRAQKIQVAPSQVMADEPADIVVSGAAANARVTIRAELTDGGGHAWAAQADFVADGAGSIDTAKQAPVSGSYKTISAMGLVWSMRPTERDVHVYAAPRDFGPQVILFHLLVNGQEVSSAQLTQLAIGPDVQRINVNGDLDGALFLPGGAGKHPGVLVVGGSEGGTPGRKAAWLASHGYAALALCYFHCAGRPQQLQRIPLEYFGQALEFMMKRPEIDADRLAVMGTSRGGELALQLGSLYRQIKAVVAYVPANVRGPSCCDRAMDAAWTWRGQPLVWVLPNVESDSALSLRAQIAVEETNGPILMIGAEDDGVWPSARMVREASGRLRANHFPHQVVVLVYPHAGHRAGQPDIAPAWTNGVTHPISGRTTEFGGSPEGNAQSSLDAIPKVLDFLEKSLGGAAVAKESPKEPFSEALRKR
jgi:dienelactone hydrolase